MTSSVTINLKQAKISLKQVKINMRQVKINIKQAKNQHETWSPVLSSRLFYIDLFSLYHQQNFYRLEY